MTKNKLSILIAFIVFSLFCSSTRITNSWREPDKSVDIEKLNTALVLELFKDETSSHRTEDVMEGYLNGKGIESYNYLNINFNEANEELLRHKIKADGFDGVVTMRLVDVDKEKIYTLGNITYYPNYYRSFSGYYYRSWSNYSTLDYYSTTNTYIIETNDYSIKSDKILWAGLTQTTDPNGFQKMTEEVAQSVDKQIIKEGFCE